MDLMKLVPQQDGNNLPSLEFYNKFQKWYWVSWNQLTKVKSLMRCIMRKFSKNSTRITWLGRGGKIFTRLEHTKMGTHFGAEGWYKESTNISIKFLSLNPIDVYFEWVWKDWWIFWINWTYLEKSFADGESEGFKLLKMSVPVLPETLCQYLKNVPRRQPAASRPVR